MNLRCFLQIRILQTLFHETLGQVLVSKHTTKSFKRSDELFKHSAELLRVSKSQNEP